MTPQKKYETSFMTRVAGVARRQEIVKACQEGESVSLIRESSKSLDKYDRNAIRVASLFARRNRAVKDANKYDWNAIRVESDGGVLGYLPSATAGDIASFMDEGYSVRAAIDKITGGTEGKPTTGLVLSVVLTPKGFDDTDSESIHALSKS